MGACSNVFEDDTLEVSAGDALIIEKHIESMMGKVLKYCERPRKIRTAIT